MTWRSPSAPLQGALAGRTPRGSCAQQRARRAGRAAASAASAAGRQGKPGKQGAAARMDNYNVIELVGEGSFGKVYKARRRFTGQIVVRAARSRARQPARRACSRRAPALTRAPPAAGHQVHPQARQEREGHPLAAPGNRDPAQPSGARAEQPRLPAATPWRGSVALRLLMRAPACGGGARCARAAAHPALPLCRVSDSPCPAPRRAPGRPAAQHENIIHMCAPPRAQDLFAPRCDASLSQERRF